MGTRRQLFTLYLFNTVLQFRAISSIPKIKRDSCSLVALEALRTQGCGSRKEGQLLDLAEMGRGAGPGKFTVLRDAQLKS